MPKENVYDRVLDKTSKRIESATDRIAKDFKGVKPFDKEIVKDADLLPYFDELTQEDMLFLIQKHGEETVNNFIYDMEMARRG